MKVIMPGANREAMQADLERRRSNAARPVPARKARRQGSRKAARAAAVREFS